jgi:hypothetical protein
MNAAIKIANHFGRSSVAEFVDTLLQQKKMLEEMETEKILIEQQQQQQQQYEDAEEAIDENTFIKSKLNAKLNSSRVEDEVVDVTEVDTQYDAEEVKATATLDKKKKTAFSKQHSVKFNVDEEEEEEPKQQQKKNKNNISSFFQAAHASTTTKNKKNSTVVTPFSKNNNSPTRTRINNDKENDFSSTNISHDKNSNNNVSNGDENFPVNPFAVKNADITATTNTNSKRKNSVFHAMKDLQASPSPKKPALNVSFFFFSKYNF